MKCKFDTLSSISCVKLTCNRILRICDKIVLYFNVLNLDYQLHNTCFNNIDLNRNKSFKKYLSLYDNQRKLLKNYLYSIVLSFNDFTI